MFCRSIQAIIKAHSICPRVYLKRNDKDPSLYDHLHDHRGTVSDVSHIYKFPRPSTHSCFPNNNRNLKWTEWIWTLTIFLYGFVYLLFCVEGLTCCNERVIKENTVQTKPKIRFGHMSKL